MCEPPEVGYARIVPRARSDGRHPTPRSDVGPTAERPKGDSPRVARSSAPHLIVGEVSSHWTVGRGIETGDRNVGECGVLASK